VTVIGIDGCRSGWIAVALGDDGVAAHHLRHISEVGDASPEAELIAIDIPIGLPEGGQRHADVAARQFLGRRRNSVFLAPIRSAAEALSHAEATATSRRMIGSGISQQAFALRRKKTWAGMVERLDALNAAGIDLNGVDPAVGSAVAVDDMLDAAVAAWTARRLADGVARPFPHDPLPDASGRVIAIWA
jgi:predicted RNase H-like nuclease